MWLTEEEKREQSALKQKKEDLRKLRLLRDISEHQQKKRDQPFIKHKATEKEKLLL